MPEREKIRTEIDVLGQTLDRLTEAKSELCENTITGGVAVGNYPDLAELEEVRSKAEAIRHQLAGLKGKSKIDPEVRELETKLENILTRYYWLWQKCKASLP